MGAAGLLAILIFAHTVHLDSGTAAGLGASSLTQTSMMGTAAGALEQLGLSPDLLKQQQANIAAGYAVTLLRDHGALVQRRPDPSEISIALRRRCDVGRAGGEVEHLEFVLNRSDVRLEGRIV